MGTVKTSPQLKPIKMSAFASSPGLPPCVIRHVIPLHAPVCTLTRSGRGGRRRVQASKLEDMRQLSCALPDKFLQEVRRLVRARSFMDAVQQSLHWPYIRFTNILFVRPAISDDNPDGIPESLQHLQRRVDYEFVDVPPGLLMRSANSVGVEVDAGLRLCAVFEAYGVEMDRVQSAREEREKEMERQMEKWMDVGLSLRTETDIGGGDIYCENMMDFLE